jgi:uncharacterized damage-inducible protein DinB
MFRSIARVVVPAGMVFVSALASSANAQQGMPNPIMASNPLTTTLSIFRSNMQDKIMKSAEAMPESKYRYRPTKDGRSFAEILTHIADISYTLCSNVKGEANPIATTTKVSKTEIMAYLKGSFDYCDGVYSGFTDAHLNDPADFFGAKTNKMFVLTQVGNHDALHYGNLVTYLRLNGLVPSGAGFEGPAGEPLASRIELFNAMDRVEVMIAYGPLEMNRQTWILPMRRVSISRLREQKNLHLGTRTSRSGVTMKRGSTN